MVFKWLNSTDAVMDEYRLKGDGRSAIHCSSDRLAFESGHSVSVCDECDRKETNYSNVSDSFENNTEIDSKYLLDGSETFTVEEIIQLILKHLSKIWECRDF
jgi:hypothetical protein